MKPSVRFKLSGIQLRVDDDDARTFPVTDDLVETVEILQDKAVMCGMEFTLKEGVRIDEGVVAQATQKARDFLVELCGRLHPSVRSLALKVEQTCDPGQGDTILVNAFESVGIRADCQVIKIFEIDRFRDCFGQKNLRGGVDDKYMLLYHILKIGNIVTRYLMQYELLLDLVTEKHAQKEVTAFIREEYNPANPQRMIGFHTTRKPGKSYEEDDLTYYRNLLGHNDGTEGILEEKIGRLNDLLLDVIFFALHRSEK